MKSDIGTVTRGYPRYDYVMSNFSFELGVTVTTESLEHLGEY